jgi:hypothetical protein
MVGATRFHEQKNASSADTTYKTTRAFALVVDKNDFDISSLFDTWWEYALTA